VPYQLPENWPQEFEKLIWKVIRNSFQGYRDENDLLQEGFLAVMYAAEKFDEKQTMKFTTYVYQLIYWRLLRFTKNNMLNFSQLPKPNGEYKISTNPETLIGFSKLTEQAQLIIMLKLEGKSFTKIGEILGMNRESARIFHKKSTEQFHNQVT